MISRIEKAVDKGDKAEISQIISHTSLLNQTTHWEFVLEHLSGEDWEALVYNALGITYYHQLRDFSKSVEFHIKAGEEFFNFRVDKYAGLNYEITGDIYKKHLHDEENARTYYLKAGEMYEEAGMFEDAQRCYEKAGG
ncbi:MAG: hypothetical protein NC821_04110 [Candidatus Omnitrophica bacterium]|nr:hypothetical protein [Candidatus Omnitrophota bacterium]